MNRNPQYEAIQGNNDEAMEASSPIRSGNKVWTMMGAALVVVTLLVLGISAVSNRPTVMSVPTESIVAPLEGSTRGVRPCSFDECFATNCNAGVAPYTCLFHNGGPHGGCSPSAWLEETCDDQCNLEDCGDMVIPDEVAGCKGVECGTEWCKQGQVCPEDVSYQCTEGSARFGCSTDPLQWTLRTGDSVCSECCDASTC
jgi:hypothetical protein